MNRSDGHGLSPIDSDKPIPLLDLVWMTRERVPAMTNSTTIREPMTMVVPVGTMKPWHTPFDNKGDTR